MSFLKNKAKTLEDIYNNSKYIIFDEINFIEDDLKLIDDKAKKNISDFKRNILELKDFNKEILELIINDLIKTHKTKFKAVGQHIKLTASFGIATLGKNKMPLDEKVLIAESDSALYEAKENGRNQVKVGARIPASA